MGGHVPGSFLCWPPTADIMSTSWHFYTRQCLRSQTIHFFFHWPPSWLYCFFSLMTKHCLSRKKPPTGWEKSNRLMMQISLGTDNWACMPRFSHLSQDLAVLLGQVSMESYLEPLCAQKPEKYWVWFEAWSVTGPAVLSPMEDLKIKQKLKTFYNTLLNFIVVDLADEPE